MHVNKACSVRTT